MTFLTVGGHWRGRFAFWTGKQRQTLTRKNKTKQEAQNHVCGFEPTNPLFLVYSHMWILNSDPGKQTFTLFGGLAGEVIEIQKCVCVWCVVWGRSNMFVCLHPACEAGIDYIFEVKQKQTKKKKREASLPPLASPPPPSSSLHQIAATCR